MPTTSKRATAARRKPAVTSRSPKPVADRYPFELGGETYHAMMPKDFVWLELFAAGAADATIAQKAQANSSFLQACLNETDRERIKARMHKPPSEDPVRGMELLSRIKDLVELWQPFVEAEFNTAIQRAEAAA